jgi:hypothetical protein
MTRLNVLLTFSPGVQEELGKARMDTLPMEDNRRDDRGPRRGPPHRVPPRQWAGPVTPQRPAGGVKPKTIWDGKLTIQAVYNFLGSLTDNMCRGLN